MMKCLTEEKNKTHKHKQRRQFGVNVLKMGPKQKTWRRKEGVWMRAGRGDLEGGGVEAWKMVPLHTGTRVAY